MAVSSLLNTGAHALLANQVALNVTGNNVANVETEGYCRQSVRFEEFTPMNRRPGQIGQGAYVSEVYRSFNRFVENSYLDRFTQQERWNEESTILSSVENIFNEANRDGISSQLASFFRSWSKLASTPDDQATREALLAQSNNLALLMRDTKANLQDMQREMDDYIKQTVDEANSILDQLLKVNKQIAVTDVPGVNNANSLYDTRDTLTRKLSGLLDIRVDDKGGTDFAIYTKGGQPLLHEQSVFKLSYQDSAVEKQTKGFMGDMVVSGQDSYEYTMEFVNDKDFRVSLDGGKSWLRDDDGKISTFTAPPAGQTLRVKNLDISFDYTSVAADDKFASGDRFFVTPKSGVYWDSPTRENINVTPQTNADGTENPNRITGGKLAAYFNVRDYDVGRYIDKLDALAKSLTWEVNSLHSQGAGLKPLTNMQGSYTVGNISVPLGSRTSGMAFGDKLQSGNLSFHFYDATTGASVNMGTNSLDFGGGANFDPSKHSLQDVAAAINNSYPDPANPGRNMVTATIEGGKLCVQAAAGVTFKMGSDTSGLLAGLGLNTFFQGSSASDFSINPILKDNLAYINAQSVDGQDQEGNVGDGGIAARLAQLATKELTISTTWENSKTSLTGYYAGLVGLVGSDTQTANFNAKYHTSLTKDVETQSASISGVNVDEEMTNLIRFQHSYTAAAKLVTTADQMLETILGLKQ